MESIMIEMEDLVKKFPHTNAAKEKTWKTAVAGISLSVRHGEVFGLLGPNGAGKTTIIRMLTMQTQPTSGVIRIGGADIRRDPRVVKERIGVVPQRSVLFSGTLRENMCWGKKDATDEEIREALRIAQALPFVEEKGEGLSLLIEQEGRNLSGGQRQRLCIARALLRRPEILILDDSASALDFATDAALRSALREYSKDSTVFLISQRVASVRNSDRILVLEDGHMAGLGKHDLLFRESPVYREICLSQLSREEAEE